MTLNKKGFTLVEALIVLMIISIISLFSFQFIVKLHDRIVLHRFLAQLQSDLHYLRNMSLLALERKEKWVLTIFHEEGKYRITCKEDEMKTRFFPHQVNMPHGQRLTTLSYNEEGNINQGRTLAIESSYYKYQIVISIGVGGFEIREITE